MTPTEALAELAALGPRAAELVGIVRKAQRGGRPPRKQLDAVERRLATLRAVRAAFKKEPSGILSRSQLLTALRHTANAKVLSGVLFDLEVMDEIRSETNTGPNGGRPQTLYMQT